MLHGRHEPFGTLREGALLVARGVEVGLGHVALVGRPIMVDDDAVDDVLALLHRAPDRALRARPCAGPRNARTPRRASSSSSAFAATTSAAPMPPSRCCATRRA